MHELSIAMSIVEIAEDYASKEGADQIKQIDLEIGELSGVVLEALDFAFKSAVNNTMLENAEIKINVVKGEARCIECGHVFQVSDLFTPCPDCQSFNIEIIAGKELKVKSLFVD